MTDQTATTNLVPVLYRMLEQGIIEAHQVQMALYEHRLKNTCPLGYLMRMKVLCDESWLQFASNQWGIALFERPEITVHITSLQIIGAHKVKEALMLPVQINDQCLEVAIVEPYVPENWTELTAVFEFKYQIVPKLVSYAVFLEAMAQYLPATTHTESIVVKICDDPHQLRQPIEEKQHLVVLLVEQILLEANSKRCSDIHFDPQQYQTVVRMRIDGILVYMLTLHSHLWQAVVIRIKVLAQLDISENRLPQEGSFKVNKQSDLNIRVAILPGIWGEHIVLRFQKSEQFNTLYDIGIPEDIQQNLRFMMNQPHGLIVIAGPTGSGKSTTLYSLLKSLNHERLNIITLEDPVEQQLHGIRQIEIHEAIGLDFHKALKLVLRQDPDVILVGEIRDAITADLAIKASMTGHLVLATVHANDLEGILSRLMDLQISPALLKRQLQGLISQRLLRKRCLNCQGVGCGLCHDTGYAGRFAIMETLVCQWKDHDEMIVPSHIKRLKHYAKVAIDEALCDQQEIERVFGESFSD